VYMHAGDFKKSSPKLCVVHTDNFGPARMHVLKILGRPVNNLCGKTEPYYRRHNRELTKVYNLNRIGLHEQIPHQQHRIKESKNSMSIAEGKSSQLQQPENAQCWNV
jgi:hypothetical protein